MASGDEKRVQNDQNAPRTDAGDKVVVVDDHFSKKEENEQSKQGEDADQDLDDFVVHDADDGLNDRIIQDETTGSNAI